MNSYLSVLAVIGAWVGGVGILFSLLGFMFGIINVRLFKFGLTWLAISDAGILLMLGALFFLVDSNVLFAFTIVGIVLLLGITAFVFKALKGYTSEGKSVEEVIEGIRSRVEF